LQHIYNNTGSNTLCKNGKQKDNALITNTEITVKTWENTNHWLQ
jgi:hypothetical protein